MKRKKLFYYIKKLGKKVELQDGEIKKKKKNTQGKVVNQVQNF